MSPHDSPRFRCVTNAELHTRQSRNAQLIEFAAPQLRVDFRNILGYQTRRYLVDGDGIVLASRGDTRTIAECALSPGFDWSESQMGTNSAGTALVAGVAVAVIGCDHWVTQQTLRDAMETIEPARSRNGFRLPLPFRITVSRSTATQNASNESSSMC